MDVHSNNQKVFNLPERIIAKTFLFRAIYKGSAYAYANDPEFMPVSKSEKYWQDVIDRMYDKYYGLRDWHTKIIQEVNATGKLASPTGRVYEFKKNRKDEYSVHDISNYPNQGLGAEAMAIVRVTAWRRYQNFHLKDRFLFVNTVHDSIVVDADVEEGSSELEEICMWLEDLFLDMPRNFERLYGLRFNVPFSGECKYGPSWADMKKFKRS